MTTLVRAVEILMVDFGHSLIIGVEEMWFICQVLGIC